MNRVYIPSMTEAIGAYEAGQDRRQQRDEAEGLRQMGGFMASGDYAGAARSAYARGDLDRGLKADQLGKAKEDQRFQTQFGQYLKTGDFKGAMEFAYGGGRVELGQQARDALDQANEREAAFIKANSEKIAAIAAPLLDISDMNARRAYIQRNAPTLISLGFQPEGIASYEPTDETIYQTIAEALGAAEYLNQRDKRLDNERADAQLDISRGNLGVSQGQLALARQRENRVASQPSGGAGDGSWEEF